MPIKVTLDGLKRSMSRGNSVSDELELRSVLGDTRTYRYTKYSRLGVAIQSRKVTRVRENPYPGNSRRFETKHVTG